MFDEDLVPRLLAAANTSSTAQQSKTFLQLERKRQRLLQESAELLQSLVSQQRQALVSSSAGGGHTAAGISSSLAALARADAKCIEQELAEIERQARARALEIAANIRSQRLQERSLSGGAAGSALQQLEAIIKSAAEASSYPALTHASAPGSTNNNEHMNDAAKGEPQSRGEADVNAEGAFDEYARIEDGVFVKGFYASLRCTDKGESRRYYFQAYWDVEKRELVVLAAYNALSGEALPEDETAALVRSAATEAQAAAERVSGALPDADRDQQPQQQPQHLTSSPLPLHLVLRNAELEASAALASAAASAASAAAEAGGGSAAPACSAAGGDGKDSDSESDGEIVTVINPVSLERRFAHEVDEAQRREHEAEAAKAERGAAEAAEATKRLQDALDAINAKIMKAFGQSEKDGSSLGAIPLSWAYLFVALLVLWWIDLSVSTFWCGV